MNIHGYKQKHKTMIILLEKAQEKKQYLVKQIEGINEKIVRLEKAKISCKEQISRLREKKENGKRI